jgi:hypothetical protein
MALSDTAIRFAKAGVAPKKLSDGNGLFLLLQPSGSKLWRVRYRFAGKDKKLSIGRYPEVSLKEARRRRDDAFQLLANGLNPEEQKRVKREADATSAAVTFSLVGEEYLTKFAMASSGASRTSTPTMIPTASMTSAASHTPISTFSGKSTITT